MSYQPKSQRKLFATGLTAAMVASAVAPVAVSADTHEGFPDVPKDHHYTEAINTLAAMDVINGYDDGEFKMGNTIKREEAAQMLYKILELSDDASAAPFDDVQQGVWYSPAVNALYEADIINGQTETTFGTNLNITRAEIAQLLVEAYDIPTESVDHPFDDVEDDAWYAEAIETLYANELISGTTKTTFDPKEDMERGDFAWLLYNVEEAFGKDAELTVESVSANANADKTVTVSGEATGADAVKVSFDGETWVDATLNEDGTYTYTSDALEPGTYTVSVAAYNGEEVSEVKTTDVAVVTANAGVAGFVTLGGTATKGVNVEVDGQSTLTNDEGYFALDNVSPGEYTAKISKAGYGTEEVSVKVFEGKASAIIEDLTELSQEDITVSTTVVNEDTGAPVENVSATLEKWNQTDEEWEEVTLVTGDTTDADGLLEIVNTAAAGASGELDFGDNLRLQLTKEYADNLSDAYASTDWIEFTLDADTAENVLSGVELDAVDASTISGEVSAEDGTAVATQDVVLLDQDGETTLDTVQTDANGEYSFEDLDLPTGEYYVQVNTGGTEANYVAAVEVTEGTEITHDVQLEQGYTVDYTVAPEEVGGEFPAGDYTATVKSNGGVVTSQTVTVAAASTAPDLNFDNLTNIPAGDFTVEFSGDYVLPSSNEVTVVDGTVTESSRVPLAGVISGVVSENDATVNLLNADGEVVETTTSDESTGDFTFASIAAGDYKVEATKSGFEKSTTDELSVTKAASTDAGTITLDAVETTADVSGFLRTEGTLTPADSASISYYAVSVEGYDAGEFVAHDDDNTISTSGEYEVSGLTPGVYQVVVRDGENHETHVSTVTVGAGDDIENKNYTLAEGGDASLAISLIDSEGNEIDPNDVTISTSELEDEYVATGDSATLNGSFDDNADEVDTIDFSNLSQGNYTLDLEVDGYGDVESTFTVDEEEEEVIVTLTEDAEEYGATVRVVDENNNDVTDANVVALDQNGKIITKLAHDATGFYSVSEALVDGTYTVAAYKDGYVVPTKEFTVNGDDAVIDVLQLNTKY